MKTSILATTALAGVWLGVSGLTAFAGPLEDRINSGQTIRIGFANEMPFADTGNDGSPKGFVNAAVIGVSMDRGAAMQA